ncbi:hypothetical protein P691DRAFT_776218 [Macrolepiota fuliginosa MF-IS2]|uniref:Invertebrate defensins family profile domain-containing protein n=1 Tax=Macrolepiota fuliginosa MF-IS2 TaxID=1400762 RepID=A0A9P6C335_9AGAR|nr:hypothetical protein P691DRAFT_776218 [Macrolepiota fuliginosa MF-IS2]
MKSIQFLFILAALFATTIAAPSAAPDSQISCQPGSIGGACTAVCIAEGLHGGRCEDNGICICF